MTCAHPLRARRPLLGAAVLALAACSAYGPGALAPGAECARIVEHMGEPTASHPRADGGERLEYARGPAGLHTYMLDLDAHGRLQGWAQVLDRPHFDRVRPGLDRRVLRERLGAPAETRIYPRQNEEVWSYRFDDPLCWWFQVSLDVGGAVRETAYRPDPRCERLDADPL